MTETFCPRHYDFDTCEAIADSVYQDIVIGRETIMPAKVWVAIAVWTKAVAVNVRRDIPGGQVQGRMGIFANAGSVETRDVISAEVVAVCYTQAECEQVVADHKAVHGDAAEYKVAEYPVGVPQRAVVSQPQAITAPCVKCGTILSDGTSFCAPCRKALHDAQKEADPGDVEPVRPNTYTPPWDRSGKGSGM